MTSCSILAGHLESEEKSGVADFRRKSLASTDSLQYISRRRVLKTQGDFWFGSSDFVVRSAGWRSDVSRPLRPYLAGGGVG